MTGSVGDFDVSDDGYFFEKYPPEIQPYETSRLHQNGAEVEAQMARQGLSSRIVYVQAESNNKYSTYGIDDLIRVRAPSDAFRNATSAYWDQRHASSKTSAWFSGTVTVLSLAGAAGAFALSTPVISAVCGVFAVGMLFLTIYNVSLANQAFHQKEGWDASPAEKIANERTAAYKYGFSYVYGRDLKLTGKSNHALLLPFEVLFLFGRYFDTFYKEQFFKECHTDKLKKDWITSFLRYNPVSKDLLEYAYGTVPDEYMMVSRDYEAVAAFLKDLQHQFEELRSGQRAQTQVIIHDINQKRELTLLPFKLMLYSSNKEAEKTRDEELEKLGVGQENERRKITEKYKNSKATHQAFYNLASLPVHAYFDGKVREAKSQLKTALEAVNNHENSATAVHFAYNWDLLKHAWDIKNNHGTYPQQTFIPAQVFNIPAPVAPKIDVSINFIQQAQGQPVPQGINISDYQNYLHHLTQQQARP